MGLAYGEMVKLISNHQAELQYAKRMLLKVMGSADQMLKDAPSHPEGHPEVPAIEEEQTRTILDTESDHADWNPLSFTIHVPNFKSLTKD